MLYTRQTWRPGGPFQDLVVEFAPARDPDEGFYRDPVRWLLVKTQAALLEWPTWDDDTVVVVCVEALDADELQTEWRGARWRHLLYIRRADVGDYPEGVVDPPKRFALHDRCHAFTRK